MENQLVSLSALGLAEDGKIYIRKTEDVIYKIDSEEHIVIEAGVNAKLVDNLSDTSVSVTVEEGASLSYLVYESGNVKRSFEVAGELIIHEISVEKTEESLNVSLVKENARAEVHNLSIAARDNSRFTQRIDHVTGSTFSNIQNVGVAMNGSTLVFDTTGYIKKGMAKSKCSQLSRGIVMDNESVITAKPILLIDEFDCFANHGASIGKMSDEDLFYLMSRGLSKKDAFLLILQGIIRPFIDVIPFDEEKERINTEIQKRIGD